MKSFLIMTALVFVVIASIPGFAKTDNRMFYIGVPATLVGGIMVWDVFRPGPKAKSSELSLELTAGVALMGAGLTLIYWGLTEQSLFSDNDKILLRPQTYSFQSTLYDGAAFNYQF